METLSALEVVALAKQRELSINRRTLRLYVDMGLVPKPDIRNREEGGRSGFYDPRVVGLLESIGNLQGCGYALKAIKDFFDTVESIARRSGKDPLDFKVRASEAISGGSGGSGGRAESGEPGQPGQPGESSGPVGAGTSGSSGGLEEPVSSGVLSDTALWRSIGGPVIAEMLRRGQKTDVSDISELRVTVVTRDGQQIAVPVFLDPASVEFSNPGREDDEELDRLVCAYLGELAGKPHPPSGADSIRSWLEDTYDMSRANFIIVRRHDTGAPMLGFAGLGVEPERLRAGQVRLEGPYVMPEYRNQGLGRLLLSRMETLATGLGATHMDAFLDSEARQCSSFLRHLGFSPDHFLWEARAKLPPVSRSGQDPLADKSPMRARLEIRPVASPEDLEQALALGDEIQKGMPGHYRAHAEDLVKSGVTFPMEGHFNAYMDGQLVGTLWNSAPSLRVYAVVLPRYRNTWVEMALWRHILRYLRDKGKKEVRTEGVSETASGRKALTTLGFAADRLIVCYRKSLLR